MIVVVANNLPPAVRGRMKLWFVEPRANVFVSGVKDAVACHVVEYLLGHGSAHAGGIIFKSLSEPPGYEIRTIGLPDKDLCEISGLQLVIEKLLKSE